MKSARTALVLTTAGALVLGISACAPTPADDGKVTLKVAIDVGLEQGAIDAFEARAAQFEDANPDIDIEAQEYNWSGTTFTTELAGGTLPDVFTIPFTDGRGLIERQQIADISGLVADLPYADSFNPNVALAGEDADGDMWAIPIAAYGQGLHYNRALFEAAGLDPDSPPTSWDEVREAAATITEKTGETGYAQMTSANTGGWILTTVDYTLGGRTEEVDGDDVTATLDTPEMADALGLLHDMRWEDNSMGANFLYDWGTIHQDFGAGRIGMFISGGGDYGNLITQNAMNPDDYGVTVLPLDGDDAAVLGGGTLAAVSAKSSEANQAAAVKWIDFYYVQKLTNEDAAVLDAKTANEAGTPVGTPELPVFDEQSYTEKLGWIEQYINVPLEQMAPYSENIFDQALAPEPSHSTQEIYALLDPVVQSVLTDENADIAALLAAVEEQAQALLST